MNAERERENQSRPSHNNIFGIGLTPTLYIAKKMKRPHRQQPTTRITNSLEYNKFRFLFFRLL
jgi:hypothetical protein